MLGLECLQGTSKLELIEWGTEEAPGRAAGAIYGSFRSYKNDRCAIFAGEDEIEPFLERSLIDADRLDPRENFHWQGTSPTMQRSGPRRHWKRIMIGDYTDWFQWCMRWQRFNAFHTVVLLRPISRMLSAEDRGYMDGFLTRLLNKPTLYRVIMIEEESLWPLAQEWLGYASPPSDVGLLLAGRFGREEVREAILATLYGTRLSHTDLADAMGQTLSSKLNQDWRSILQRTETSALVRRRNNFRVLDEDAIKMVQSLADTSARGQDNHELFQLSRKREHLRGGDAWVEEQALRLLDEQGWFTIPMLYDHVKLQLEDILRRSSPPPRAIMDQFERGPDDPPMVSLPSRAVLRRVAEQMATELRLTMSTWFREVGRPTTVYHRPGSSSPFDQQEHRCGQCAFYVPLRGRCRLWWLLDKAFGTRDPRWTKEGARPLSPFEIYKMRNSWRIGPHSTACSRFTHKKRDHRRDGVPERCEVCDEPLPEPRSMVVVCRNCRTRYVTVKKRGVRVLTAYEHEFERNYLEIAGRDPASDITRLEEERLATARAMEQVHYEARVQANGDRDQPRALMIYPGTRMLVRDGVLYVLERRDVEGVPLAGATLFVASDDIDDEQLRSLEDAGATIRRMTGPRTLPSQVERRFDIGPMVERAVVERPELARGFAVAMGRSALHATERIASLAETSPDNIRASLMEQRRLLGLLEKPDSKGFLTCEARMMKQYWRCFDLPLRLAFERFGPRKKSRFVKEFVMTVTGRARGYSAADAAINYLHQRRLFRCREVNVRLGLRQNPGEGFLHRRRWNSDGLGLLLDLIDPFKFADREKLLEAVSESRISWHEFHSATDRHGIRFYYPKPETVGTLECIGDQADAMLVEYAHEKLPLMDAYQGMVSDLIGSLRDGEPFTPFEY